MFLAEDSGTFRDCRRSCTDPWYPAECPAAVSFVAEGSAAVALGAEIALREDLRATFRSLVELWWAWAGGVSPTGPLEGLLPIEGGERCDDFGPSFCWELGKEKGRTKSQWRVEERHFRCQLKVRIGGGQ